MDYQVVYEAPQPYYAWWWPALGLVFFILAGLSLKSIALISLPSITSRVWIWLGICWVAIFGSITYLDYHAQRQLEAGRYAIVEGQVENFKPQLQGGHDREQFTVNGISFAYIDKTWPPRGFNQATISNGPIHAGLHVRIGYIPTTNTPEGNIIVKLEIKR